MKSSSQAFFPLGVLVSAITLVLSFGGGKHEHQNESELSSVSDSTLKFTIPSSADVETTAVEFKEFRGGAESVTAIPKSAITRKNGKTYVFAQPNEDEAVFERWEVTLGYGNNANYVEALSGVFPGDEVITSGLERLARQSDPEPLTESDENRFVFGNDQGVGLKAPAAYEKQLKGPVKERVPGPAYDQTGNRFGYRAEEESGPGVEVKTYRKDRYVHSGGERYILAPRYEISHEFRCDRGFREDDAYAPPFAPSCHLTGPDNYDEDHSVYCPNDRYRSWGH